MTAAGLLVAGLLIVGLAAVTSKPFQENVLQTEAIHEKAAESAQAEPSESADEEPSKVAKDKSAGTAADDSADGRAPVDAADGCGGASCSCGSGMPELDVRDVPQVIRHSTVLNALESVPQGAGVLLIAPHDPLPLLRQIERRWHGEFEVAYLQRGPEAWRLALVRAG